MMKLRGAPLALPAAGLAAAILLGCASGIEQTVRRGDLQALGAGTVFRDCEVCPEMVVVPPGRFLMGSPESETERWGTDREGPQHQVTIARALAVGRFEVTRAQFAEFVEDTKHAGSGCTEWTGARWKSDPARSWREAGFPQTDGDPAVCVSWTDAQAYVRWLARRTGKSHRLLSEAEWEYAARAGTTTSRYWGDSADEGCRYANLGDLEMRRALGFEPAADCSDGRAYTAPAGSYRPNAFGLYDMLGNAWEWTADCWHESYRGAPADGSAWAESADCAQRAARGASFSSNPRNVRSANRGNFTAATRYTHVGFRVARDADGSRSP